MDIFSFGAGVQSTTILLMALHNEIKRPDYIVFSDPGWEPKHVYDHVEWLKKEIVGSGMEIITTNNGSIREGILHEYEDNRKSRKFASLPFFTVNNVPIYETEGEEQEHDENQLVMFEDIDEEDNRKIIGYKKQKGMVRRQCTGEYKITPVQKMARKLLGYQPRQRIPEGTATIWLGISTDEIQRIKPSRDKWIKNYYPLIEKDMSRQDCLNWMESKGYPRPPKSACIGCPFHNDAMWLEMKKNDPESWNDAVLIDKHIRKLPRFTGNAFLHRSCKPLDEVDFGENQLNMFDDGFLNECEGFCGI